MRTSVTGSLGDAEQSRDEAGQDGEVRRSQQRKYIKVQDPRERKQSIQKELLEGVDSDDEVLASLVKRAEELHKLEQEAKLS